MVEPRYNERAKGLEKCVRYTDCQGPLYLGSFLFMYFAITGHGVKEIVRYSEDSTGDQKRILTKESAVVTMLY